MKQFFALPVEKTYLFKVNIAWLQKKVNNLTKCFNFNFAAGYYIQGKKECFLFIACCLSRFFWKKTY